MIIHISDQELEIELCFTYDNKVRWFNEELKIQPKSKHLEMREVFDKLI
ncbi:hypothetical protein LCGC14_1036110 [marine sediment metagenome]|uniref:Uncharacterized protein n=1 Tax=marine sediment metagenome TaxID=412755 RepID=A0A0F9MXU3_9ZZZZ